MTNNDANLLDVRAHDGSRHFAAIADCFGSPWESMRMRLEVVSAVTLREFIGTFTQATADFEFRGHTFTVDTQFGELWLFVQDPTCPDDVLVEVVRLFRDVPE